MSNGDFKNPTSERRREACKAWQLEQKGRTHGRVFRIAIDWLFSGMEADHCHKAYLTFLRITGAQR